MKYFSRLDGSDKSGGIDRRVIEKPEPEGVVFCPHPGPDGVDIPADLLQVLNTHLADPAVTESRAFDQRVQVLQVNRCSHARWDRSPLPGW
jgi:hypothetical protein